MRDARLVNLNELCFILVGVLTSKCDDITFRLARRSRKNQKFGVCAKERSLLFGLWSENVVNFIKSHCANLIQCSAADSVQCVSEAHCASFTNIYICRNKEIVSSGERENATRRHSLTHKSCDVLANRCHERTQLDADVLHFYLAARTVMCEVQLCTRPSEI